MVISKEDALFKTRPKPKVNVQLRWISLFLKSSWIKTTASGFISWTKCKWWKNVNRNWGIINKNGHSTFYTGKPGNFNSLREVIWIILTLLPWNWLKMRVSVKKSVMVINILQMICIGHVVEAPGLYQQTLL